MLGGDGARKYLSVCVLFPLGFSKQADEKTNYRVHMYMCWSLQVAEYTLKTNDMYMHVPRGPSTFPESKRFGTSNKIYCAKRLYW